MKEKSPKSEIHKSIFLFLSSRMAILNIGMFYVMHLITKQNKSIVWVFYEAENLAWKKMLTNTM